VAVRKFIEWAEGEMVYPNIAREVKGARSPRNIKKDPLTIDQVKELLTSINRSSLQE
jgi:integrase